ncbi:hypothetical protein [Acidithiobacillus sp. AMEEHan]|uniref:hypothetical protein n=1 Tax=Acidithiobacillus sp. AMEEHan TaxID=2994951 RepID=UPI0027E57255|nr:hypothetical protein [Acidithiobacillus sp. AMEEHan]
MSATKARYSTNFPGTAVAAHCREERTTHEGSLGYRSLLLVFCLNTLSAATALAGPVAQNGKGGLDEFLATPAAPKSTLYTESLGSGDPYPAVEALVRHNEQRLADLDWKGMRSYDGSSAGYMGDVGIDDDLEPKLRHVFFKALENCRGMSQTDMPKGVTLSDDLHDYVFNPSAVQASLAMQGILFAPEFSNGWKPMQFSWQFAHNHLQHWDGTEKKGYTQIQNFWRVLFFVSTGTTQQVRAALIKAAADHGYALNPLPKGPGWQGGDGFLSFSQRVTPLVKNFALVTISNSGKAGDDAESPEDLKLNNQLRSGGWRCLISDDFAKGWLSKVNPKTGRRYQLEDLTMGYIVQRSPLPLGKNTEQFTNAHVRKLLDDERKLSPTQLLANTKSVDKRITLDAFKHSPQRREKMLEAAKNLNSAAAESRKAEQELPKLAADMLRLEFQADKWNLSSRKLKGISLRPKGLGTKQHPSFGKLRNKLLRTRRI